MYLRVYSRKNNTLVKDNSGPAIAINGNLNSGLQTIMELRNGNSFSRLVFDFDITDLFTLLSANSYTCKLKLWDAGTIFEPVLKPQNVDLIFFEQDFVEGNGFSFSANKAIEEVSNFNKRDSLNDWAGVLDSIKATGSFTIVGGFAAGDAFKVGTTTFTEGVEFSLGFDDTATANNLTTAINLHPVASTLVLASHNFSTSNIIILTATLAGVGGNSTVIQIVTGTHTASGATLTGGVSIQGLFPALQLDKTNEDLVFDVTSFVQQAVIDNKTPKFCLQVSDYEIAETVFTKFIHSNHTRTIYQPFLEFTIEDDITDQHQQTVATKNSQLFLLNDSGEDFVGTLTVEIQDTNETILATPTIQQTTDGVYYVDYTPVISLANNVIFDVWKIDGVTIAKNAIVVQSPNQVLTNPEKFSGLFFYPITTYTHSSIRKNDVVEFTVVSEIRGQGIIVSDKYEYRIVATNNFEMIPWSPVSVYNNRMFFKVDTKFFFPELEYEVFVRLKEKNFTKTSSLTYQFRLIEDVATHLENKAASPYQSRNRYLNK